MNRRRVKLAFTLAALTASLCAVPATAEVIEDRGNSFRALLSPGDGVEVEVHFWSESTMYSDGIPLREGGGKGGWDLYVEIRRNGKRIESGGVGEQEGDGITWTLNGLESASVEGTLPSWVYPDTDQEQESQITIDVELTGDGVAEPTLYPYRYVNPHRVEAGLGIQMSRAVTGTVSASSRALDGVFAGAVVDGYIRTFERHSVGENLIDPDRD